MKCKKIAMNKKAKKLIIAIPVIALLTIFTFMFIAKPAISGFDWAPILTFTSNTQDTETTAILTAIATDFGDNAGIEWIKIYENGNLIGTKSCSSTSCTFVKTIVKVNCGTFNYKARTKDKGGHVVDSQTIQIHFAGINQPPIIISYSPSDTELDVNVSTPIHFSVVATQLDSDCGDTLSYEWTLDDTVVSTATSYDYTPSLAEIGQHTVKVVVSDTRGGTASKEWKVNVIKMQSSCSLIFIPESSISYDQQPFIVECSCTNPEAPAELWRNGENVTEEIGKAVTLAAGTYSYVCNVSETEHYFGASNSSSYIINKSEHTAHLALNGNEADLTITSCFEWK